MNREEIIKMRQLHRVFLDIESIEIEVCQDSSGKYFVRHHIYWNIVHGSKNPDPNTVNVIGTLEKVANTELPSIRWAGHKFQFENAIFDDGLQTETILLPLKMFEDFIRFKIKYWIEREGQFAPQPIRDNRQLGEWLEKRTIEELLT